MVHSELWHQFKSACPDRVSLKQSPHRGSLYYQHSTDYIYIYIYWLIEITIKLNIVHVVIVVHVVFAIHNPELSIHHCQERRSPKACLPRRSKSLPKPRLRRHYHNLTWLDVFHSHRPCLFSVLILSREPTWHHVRDEGGSKSWEFLCEASEERQSEPGHAQAIQEQTQLNRFKPHIFHMIDLKGGGIVEVIAEFWSWLKDFLPATDTDALFLT